MCVRTLRLGTVGEAERRGHETLGLESRGGVSCRVATVLGRPTGVSEEFEAEEASEHDPDHDEYRLRG
jgi:hypothetical protein